MWQSLFIALAAFTLGSGLSAFITYWVIEKRNQNREMREVDWLRWYNDDLEAILERQLASKPKETQ